jgi:hypothetical protein
VLIEQGLLTKLTSAATLTAYVADRIHPVLAKQDVVKPYVVVTKTSAPRMIVNGACTSSLASPRFRFDCCAESYKEAKEIANVIRTLLEQFDGPICTNGPTVTGCYYQDESDQYDEQVMLYHVIVTIIVRYFE